MKDQKRLLRQQMRQAAASLGEREKSAQASAVFAAIGTLGEFRRARTVALYWSLPDELPTHEAVRRWSPEKRILLPVVENGTMYFREYTPGCELGEGALAVMEPLAGPAVDPREIDFIIVPGVAFDRECYRLGRGKGFYDHYLGGCCAFSAGVCMEHQLIENVPREVHDRQLDMVVSARASDSGAEIIRAEIIRAGRG